MMDRWKTSSLGGLEVVAYKSLDHTTCRSEFCLFSTIMITAGINLPFLMFYSCEK